MFHIYLTALIYIPIHKNWEFFETDLNPPEWFVTQCQAIQADLGRLELQRAGKVNEDKLTGF